MTKKTIDDFVTDKKTLDNIISRYVSEISFGSISEEDKGAPDVPFGPYNFNTTNRDMKTHVTLATEDNEEKDAVVEPTPKVKAITQGNKKILTDPPADDDDELDSVDFNDSIDSSHSNGVDNDDDEDLEEQITIIQHAKKDSKKEKEEPAPPEPSDNQQGIVQAEPDEKNVESKDPNAQGGFDPNQIPPQDDYQGDEDLGIDPDNSDPEGGEDPNVAGQAPNMAAGQDPNAMQQDPNAVGQDPNAMQQDPNAMGQDPNMAAGQDPNAMGGMDPNAMGGMGMDPNAPLPGAQNAEQIGRTFELKKIYNRLIAIETYLSFSTEPILLKIEQYTSKAIELFELVMTNIQMYQDKVDDIVVTYYKFLEKIYEVIKQYYALKQEKENDENNENEDNQKGDIV